MKSKSLSLVIALGALSYSCQKQDPTQELIVANTQGSATANLVATMTADATVRAFVLANERFLNEDESYYNSLSTAGQTARRADLQASFDTGAEFSDPYRTPAQVSAHYASQEVLAAQIKATYPQLYQLDEDAQTRVKMLVAQAIRNSAATATTATAPGHAGYVAAVWHGEGLDAATAFNSGRAFYTGYMGYLR